MSCEIHEEHGVIVVDLSGDVDLDSSSKVRQTLLDYVGRERDVLVDLSRVRYIDSSGIASLVEAFQSARRGKTRFALVAVSEAAMRVLELARLDRVFAIHDSLEDALGDSPGRLPGQ